MVHKWVWYTFLILMVGFLISLTSLLQRNQPSSSVEQITFETSKKKDLAEKLAILKRYILPLRLKIQFLTKNNLPALNLDAVGKEPEQTFQELKTNLKLWTKNDLENHYLIKCWNDLASQEEDATKRWQKWLTMKRFSCNQFQT